MKKDNRKKIIINDEIKGNNILLIDENGNKLGIYSKKDALEKAKQEGKDVIQVGYNQKDNIVIAKLIEYGKYLYQLKKQEKEKKKSQKIKGLKEVKFGYNIGKNDLEFKIKKIKEFLEEGYNVKILGELKGRENWYKQTMYEKMKQIEEKFKNISKSNGIKEEKRGYSLILFAKVK